MYTLILADDEEQIRSSIISLIDFESIGFKLVGQASNGYEVLELTEKLKPDLVLSDIKMPYMTGIEMAAELKEVSPSAFVVFLTGYDDFEYVRKALEYNVLSYILKPVSPDELVKELIKIKARMDRIFSAWSSRGELEDAEFNANLKRELALVKLAYGGESADNASDVQRENLLLQAGFSETNKSGGVFRVIVMQPQSEQKGVERLVDGIMRKYFQSQSAAFQDGTVVTLIYDFGGEEDKVSVAVRETLELMQKYLKSKAFCGVSAAFTSVKHVNRGYKEALLAVNGLKDDGGEIRYISDVELLSGSRDDDFADKFGEKIEGLLKFGSESELLSYLDGQIVKAEERRIDVGGLTAKLLTAIYRAVKSFTDKAPPTHIFESGAFNDALKAYGENFTRFGIGEMLVKAKRYIDAQRKNTANNLVDMAKSAVENRFTDPNLTLNSLSDELGCSVPYLSSLISKTAGVSFVSLLTEKRMEKAKELLLGSNMKISEICVRCGYIDQHYFSYTFKKYYGLSPALMRSAGKGE